MTLYNIMLPQFEDEHRDLNIQIPLKDYIALRKCEIVANELRFPGYSRLIIKKLQLFARICAGSLIANVGLLMFLGFKHKSHRSVVVKVE